MIATLLLAAGESKRMGRNKLLLPLKGKTLLLSSLENLLNSGVDEVILVLGHEAEALLNSLGTLVERAGARLRIALNENYKEGMSTSIACGLAVLREDAEAVLIALADQPLVPPEIINKVIEAFREGRGRIIVPTYKGTPGHPVLFAKEFFPEMTHLKGDVGAKSVVEAHHEGVAVVEVDLPEILFDIDSPKDYKRMAKREGLC